jgi:hypothetical protein
MGQKALFGFSVCLSIRLSACIYSAPTGRIVLKFDIGYIWKYVEKIQSCIQLDEMSGTSQEDQSTFILLTTT